MHVFIRVTFTFPKDYPHGTTLSSAPIIDAERSPLVSTRRRAYMLRRLKEIRLNNRPCLEACLKFLLFSDRQPGRPSTFDASSSSENEDDKEGHLDQDIVFALLRDHQNLAEPRTTQGAFSVNGILRLPASIYQH